MTNRDAATRSNAPIFIFAGMERSFYRKLKLKPGKERSLLNFHPWVFSGAIATAVNDFSEGELVDVYDASGNFLATGHFHHGTIMVRILTFEKRAIDSAFWHEKFASAYAFRRGLPFFNRSTNAYRLIHGEGDGLPGLIIDVYGSTAVVQAHSEGMQLALEEIAEALKNLPGPRFTAIISKTTDAIARQVSAEAGNAAVYGQGSATQVEEYGHTFYINWAEGQKTGFFLDQRENRLLLAGYAAGKRVLNTFCYSGGFSIYALKAGASHVDSVDSSARAMEWTDRNVALNSGFSGTHASHCMDVFDYLGSHGSGYDVIVLDPPAFAKHLSAAGKAVVGYRNLNAEAIRLINPGGIIFTFSCSQAIDKQLFRKTIFTAALKTGRKIRILHQLTQGPDHPVSLYHPEGEYLKGLVLQIE